MKAEEAAGQEEGRRAAPPAGVTPPLTAKADAKMTTKPDPLPMVKAGQAPAALGATKAAAPGAKSKANLPATITVTPNVAAIKALALVSTPQEMRTAATRLMIMGEKADAEAAKALARRQA